ncbi:MAG: hypothetical protein J3R72DRAFT_226309 [Linnemannia gamsii]|nr:MAG: hypothetical protein J3R72DRAFT_226309 [Linnemannia gamsii]
MSLTTRSSVQSFGTFQEHQNYHNRPFSSLSFTTTSEYTYEQSMLSRRESVATMESVGGYQSNSNSNYSTPTSSRPTSMVVPTPSRSNTSNSNRILQSAGGATGGGSVDLRRQATQKMALKQQQLRHQQQLRKKKALLLFPTERTRGAVGPGILQPVDISQIDLMPIEVSRGIIMSCIDEIKLRGLTHKYLFRNAFYSPSVEASLRLLKHPKKRNLFSVKALRIDTVGGLLTTVLSRTYPPLIPSDIQELFENPNGRFFFELLGLLPELNRYLFVEILDLCCELADRQSENHVSHSKLAIYPGSCCFGLEEYMPTWDTRYLMTPDLKKFSEAFYNIIYAYREERDLSAEELQVKLDKREKILAEERLELLEQEHGLEGAQIILRMEARLAQGLPAESPPLPAVPTSPSDLKEVSLYADRKERVVADDAISVLDMQIDLEDGDSSTSMDVSGDGQSQCPTTEDEKEEDEEEDVEKVMADLRRSVSVATLGYWSDNSTRLGGSTPSLNASSVLDASSTSNISLPQQHTYSRYNFITTIPVKVNATIPPNARPRLAHTKSLARFGSIAQNQFPVSPGDIFGISRHAIEQRELQEFLAVAREATTSRRRKSSFGKNGSGINGKRISQWRLQNKRLRLLSPASRSSLTRSPSFVAAHLATSPTFVLRRVPHHRNAVLLQAANNGNNSNSNQSQAAASTIVSPNTSPLSTSASLLVPTASRRGRTRQIRKVLEVYLSQGLTKEEALLQRTQDERRRKRDEKRAKLRAAREAEKLARRLVEQERIAEMERQAVLEQEQLKVMTMEETEVLEAFDYLTDSEFEEFMLLAGLTLQDVERIREKAAAAALEQVTEDIHATDRVHKAFSAVSTEKTDVVMVFKPEEKDEDVVVVAQASVQTEVISAVSNVKETAEKPSEEKVNNSTASTTTTFTTSAALAATTAATTIMDQPRKRYISPQHMTSMELLIKNTAVIGDSNLRCYPITPSSTARTTASDIAASAALSAAAIAASGGLLSQAATVMAALPNVQSAQAAEEEEVVEEVLSRDLGMAGNRSSVSLLITKGIPHLEQHQDSSSSASTFSSVSTSEEEEEEEEDEDEDEDSIFHDAQDSQEEEEEVEESTTAMTSTTTVTTTTSGNVQILEFETIVVEEEYDMSPPSSNFAYDSDGEELEILDVNHTHSTSPSGWSEGQQDIDMGMSMDDEEAAELQQLLESMTPEERHEFLRLSR